MPLHRHRNRLILEKGKKVINFLCFIHYDFSVRNFFIIFSGPIVIVVTKYVLIFFPVFSLLSYYMIYYTYIYNYFSWYLMDGVKCQWFAVIKSWGGGSMAGFGPTTLWSCRFLFQSIFTFLLCFIFSFFLVQVLNRISITFFCILFLFTKQDTCQRQHEKGPTSKETKRNRFVNKNINVFWLNDRISITLHKYVVVSRFGFVKLR